MQARWDNLGVLLGALGLLGCSGDFGDVGPFDGDTTGELSDGDTGETVPQADSTGSAEGSEDDDGTDTGQPPSEGECDFDCGEGGECSFDDLGSPVCLCDAGYTAFGLRCLACTDVTDTVEVDIPRVEVTASFLLNGETFPASFFEHGLVVLRDPGTGDELELGSTFDGGTTEAVPIVPGTYEVHYRRLRGGEYVPANDSAMVRVVSIPAVGSFDLELDVTAVQVFGDITLGGDSPPTGLAENGALWLRNPANGDELHLGDTRDEQYRAMVVPGTYDLHYRQRTAENIAPVNDDVRIGVVDIDSSGEQSFDIDVPVTSLTGAFLIDGGAPPMSFGENARILLRDELTGDEIELGQTFDGTYDVPVVPGEYALVYRRIQGGDLVPANRAAVLERLTLEPGDQVLDVDIHTTVLTGTITVGGAPPPSDPGNDGLVVLRNTDTGDEAIIGNTADGVYSRRVVRGPYDLYYRQETSSGGVPVNTNALLDSVDVGREGALDVDIPMVTLSADVTVSGELPPDSAFDDGLLYLRNPETDDSVLLGNTRLATLARPVVPGTYELHYVVEAAGPTMPVNAKSHLDTIDVGAVTQIDVDIPVTDFHTVVTLDGAAPPMGFTDRGALLLHDVDTEDVIYLGAIDNGELRRPLTAGTYVLAFQRLVSSGLMPTNTNAGLSCVRLIAE